MLTILGMIVGPLTAQGVKWKTMAAKLTTLESAEQVRPECCLRLFRDATPQGIGEPAQSLRLMTDGRVKPDGKGGLLLDTTGTSTWRGKVAPRDRQVFKWFAGGRFSPLLFFYRGRDWWVCSANVLTASKGKDLRLRLFDTNADGDFLDRNDAVSWQGGAMRPIANCLEVDDGTSNCQFRLVPKGTRVAIEYRPRAARPDYVDQQQWEAFRAMNALRNQHGCAPVSLWKESCLGVTAHTQFLHLNNPDLKGKSPPGNMGEPMDMPHRTEAGHKFGSSGIVATLQSAGQTTAGHVQAVANMTHSRNNVFTPQAGRVGIGRTGIWSFFRCDSAEGALVGGDYLVVPGPGVQGVSPLCGNNWPPPRSFPDLYQNNRGTPISVLLNRQQLANGSLTVRSITLVQSTNLRAVPGFFFSVRDIFPGSPDNWFFFVPADPLAAGETYLVQAMIEAKLQKDGSAGMVMDHRLLEWQFAVAK